jgi:Tfp pilus assembly protein PilX
MRRHSQRGAALVVSLIMLVLITLMVITALNLGSSNFKAVSNTQFRDEAVAAANVAIEDRLSSTFNQTPDADGNLPTTTTLVDLNNDDIDDYSVDVTPACIGASRDTTAQPSSVELPPEMTVPSTWNTVWDIASRITSAETGASIVIRSGARVLLSEVDRNRACP